MRPRYRRRRFVAGYGTGRHPRRGGRTRSRRRPHPCGRGGSLARNEVGDHPQEPVDEVKLIGTKKVTANASGSLGGSGNYLWQSTGCAHRVFQRLARQPLSQRPGHRGRLRHGEIYATDSGPGHLCRLSGGGHGYNVWIDHGNGITSRYSHCSAVLVETGQMVGQGQPICLIGATGWADGNHVHFVIEANGVPIDPLPLIS